MSLSKYEYSMELLAAMACKTIAKLKSVSPVQAFDSFIKSKTANMLFDEHTAFWCNGPDYIADEYRGTMELKKYTVQYDFVRQMPKKLQWKIEKELKMSKRKFKKTIVISTVNDNLSIAAHDLITYLKNHKFRPIPRIVPVRIAECLSPVLIWVGSSLTTKYVITEDAKRVYCDGNHELYNELSDF